MASVHLQQLSSGTILVLTASRPASKANAPEIERISKVSNKF